MVGTGLGLVPWHLDMHILAGSVHSPPPLEGAYPVLSPDGFQEP